MAGTARPRTASLINTTRSGTTKRLLLGRQIPIQRWKGRYCIVFPFVHIGRFDGIFQGFRYGLLEFPTSGILASWRIDLLLLSRGEVRYHTTEYTTTKYKHSLTRCALGVMCIWSSLYGS